MSSQGQNGGRIVVGVDGSESSMAALRWAIRQARLTGSSVDAVIAWRVPSSYGLAPIADGGLDFEGDAKKILADALTEVGGAESDVIIRPSVVEGHPADVLVRSARGADLLVVAAAAMAGSPRRCSARSAITACTTPPARSWSSGEPARTAVRR